MINLTTIHNSEILDKETKETNYSGFGDVIGKTQY